MSAIFTANRLAALATWLTALGALIASFVGVFPHDWQNAVVGIAALFTKAATVVTFLRGSQNWDSNMTQARIEEMHNNAALAMSQNELVANHMGNVNNADQADTDVTDVTDVTDSGNEAGAVVVPSDGSVVSTGD